MPVKCLVQQAGIFQTLRYPHQTIPLIGSINVTKSTFIDYLDGEKPKIINVELFDEDNARFEKFQPAGLDI